MCRDLQVIKDVFFFLLSVLWKVNSEKLLSVLSESPTHNLPDYQLDAHTTELITCGEQVHLTWFL